MLFLKNLLSKKAVLVVGIAIKASALIWAIIQWPYLIKINEISSENWLGALAIYFIYALLFVIWVDIACHRERTRLQKICIIFMIMGLVLNTLHLAFFSVPISLDSIEVGLKPILWGAGNVDVAKFIKTTYLYFKFPLILLFVMVGCFYLPPHFRRKTFFSNKILFILFIVIVAKGLNGPLYQLPPAVSFYSPIVSFFTEKTIDFDKKDPVALTPKKTSSVKNILFIIDESVRGDYLSINTPVYQTTPYLEQLKAQGVLLTYGASCSTTNYTSTSHSMMRFGADPYILLKKDRTNPYYKSPSIFMYAKKAEFQTAYVDNQVLQGTSNDYVTETEKAFIDQFNQKAPYDPLDTIDHDKIKLIKEFFENGQGPKFMIYRKMGAHLPYEIEYPKDHSAFSCGAECNHQQRVITDYKNALAYKVDDFFRNLIPLLDLENTIIIYTSDHGQSLFEDGVALGHGAVMNPPLEQANVPMVVMTKDPDLKKKFEQTTGPKTAYQIFPTLLELMGFSRNDIATVTSVHPLYENEPHEGHVFLSGNIFSTQTPPDYQVNQCYVKRLR